MTPRGFGRLAERLLGNARYSQAERDSVIHALRDAEKQLMDAAEERQRSEQAMKDRWPLSRVAAPPAAVDEHQREAERRAFTAGWQWRFELVELHKDCDLDEAWATYLETAEPSTPVGSCPTCASPLDRCSRCAWQPISSAPKDGREVLLRVAYRAGCQWGLLVGHYMRGGHCIEDHPPIDSGWYFWNGRMFDLASEPIAWMPLPAPPKENGYMADLPDVPIERIIADVIECANAWEPKVRLLGNVRAGDISIALSERERHFDAYAAAGRVIGLHLAEWCDTSLTYAEMIAEASRRAGVEVARLRAEVSMLRSQLRAAEDGRTVDRLNAEQEASTKHGEPLEKALKLAKEATNGWGCYAKRMIEHAEIARLHREIAALKGGCSCTWTDDEQGRRRIGSSPVCRVHSRPQESR